jgi:serine O-acetyltransferase
MKKNQHGSKLTQLDESKFFEEDSLWADIISECQVCLKEERLLENFLRTAIFNQDSLEDALSWILAEHLKSNTISHDSLRLIIREVLFSDNTVRKQVRMDLIAYIERDPACDKYHLPLLYFKGFHALQTHRVSHILWKKNRKNLALYIQNRASEVFSVDIHPAAKIGGGIMIDHATGLVIGETTVIDDNVSLLHSVTLGGTGLGADDRHPKIRSGVMIAAGVKILGNIEIGTGAKVGAGSLVLEPVPPHTTVAGVPSKIVGCPEEEEPSREMNQAIITNN